jgi:tetratricopeptide (TPR) repeat protein
VAQPVDLFYSYSHRDEGLRVRLEKHLSILRRSGLLRDWHDRRIGAGREWEGKIDEELERADIILLLVSADFIDSDYCWDVEMKRALARHEAGEARVIPIILKPVLWEEAPFGKLQALPRDAKAVTEWPNRETAFKNVAQGIRAVALEVSARLAVPKRISRISYPRNPAFVGRDKELDSLQSTLGRQRIVAVTGRGGAGKTQLAAEFCYRFGEGYDVVWWIRAEESATIVIDLAELAAKLGLPEAASSSRVDAVDAVLRGLAENENWLLVFDNAQSWASIERLVPKGTTGRVLVTARVRQWPSAVSVLPLDVLSREDARHYLLERTGQEDEAAADAIAAASDDLPLALEQAAAYVEATGSDLGAYAAALREEERRPATAEDESAGTPSEVALNEIAEAPAAEALITLAAFLAPDNIPLDLLAPQAAELPSAAGQSLVDPVVLDDALSALRQYSLVEVKGRDMSLHRLVQAAVRRRMEADDVARWLEAAVKVVNRAFPGRSDDVLTWPECERLLPHALEVANHAEVARLALNEASRLLNQSGLYLYGRAEFRPAQALYERALAIHEEALGPNHPNVAIDLGNLGAALHDQGDLEGARARHERALAIDEEALGPSHPNVAIRLSNLGAVLYDQRDLEGARARLERALAIDEEALGPSHPNVAIRLSNLGAVLRGQEDLEGARARLERALAIEEEALGPNHPKIAIRLGNLGAVLRDQGDLVGARTCLKRAVAILGAAYGSEHPDTTLIRRYLESLED